MHRHTLRLIAIAFTLACASVAASAELRVVASTPDLAAIARAVGGDRVDVTVIAAPAEDPHFVDPRPSYLVELSRADILLVNGLELEVGWIPPLQAQARNPAIQVGGEGYIEAVTFLSAVIGAGRVVDRAQGDVHPGGNPHFTCDPRAGRQIAEGVGQALARLDPLGAGVYAAAAAGLAARLQALADEQAARFRQLPEERRRVVTYHDSLAYLLDWLGVRGVGTVEPRPGVPPDPRRVAEVVSMMRAHGVPAVVQEEFYPRSTSARIAELTGAELVVLEAGTRVDRFEDYVAHVQGLADTLYAALAP